MDSTHCLIFFSSLRAAIKNEIYGSKLVGMVILNNLPYQRNIRITSNKAVMQTVMIPKYKRMVIAGGRNNPYAENDLYI